MPIPSMTSNEFLPWASFYGELTQTLLHFYAKEKRKKLNRFFRNLPNSFFKKLNIDKSEWKGGIDPYSLLLFLCFEETTELLEEKLSVNPSHYYYYHCQLQSGFKS